MGWNNALMRKEFEKEQKENAERYRAAGMSEEAIRGIQNFDLEQFLSDRRYYTNTQPFETSDFDEDNETDDSCSSLLLKFNDSLTTTIDDEGHSRLWWVEEITDPDLQNRIKMLPLSNLDLLTKYIFEGYTQEALSKEFHLNQSSFSRKIEKISGFLKNTHKKRVLAGYQLRG